MRQGEDRSVELRLQVQKTEEKMSALAQRLEQVDALEERLRELAQLSDPARRIAIGSGRWPGSRSRVTLG